MGPISTIITFCSSFCLGFCFSFLILFTTNMHVNSPIIEQIFNKVKTTCLKVTYKLLYGYSICQIKCIQIYNYLSPYIRSFQNKLQMFLNKDINSGKNDSKNDNKMYATKINTKIEIYDNSTLKQLFEKELKQMSETDFTWMDQLCNYTMIVTDLSEDNDANQKKIKAKKIICDTDLDKIDFNFELSDITFVALYLNYNNERYNINLKINDYNFYVVGNVINKTFLQYYMKNILHNDISINSDTEELSSSYKLELMDHEVNLMSLTETQYIIIEKNGYNVGDTNCHLSDNVSDTVEKIELYNESYDLLDDKIGENVVEK